jgi:poly(3-hydroxybutyrate) depolymerase
LGASAAARHCLAQGAQQQLFMALGTLLLLQALGAPTPPEKFFDASAVLANLTAGGGGGAAAAAARVTPGTSFIEVQFGGRARDAILYVPETPSGAVLPLVFNYHGFGSDAFQQVLYSDMNPIADEHGFAVIYPYGVGVAGVGRSFNGGSCCSISNSLAAPIDDAGLAEVWTDEVERVLAASGSTLDRSRVYSLGMSNGGFMSIRLGCTRSSLFAAVCSVTGVLGNDSPSTDDFPCDLASTEGRFVPFLHIHGTADATVPYSAVQRGIDVFRAINRCENEPPEGVVTYQRNTTTCRSFCGASAQTNVTLCSVEGGGHGACPPYFTWPPRCAPSIGSKRAPQRAWLRCFPLLRKHCMTAPPRQSLREKRSVGRSDWFGSPLCELVGGRETGCQDIASSAQAWDFFSAYRR